MNFLFKSTFFVSKGFLVVGNVNKIGRGVGKFVDNDDIEDDDVVDDDDDDVNCIVGVNVVVVVSVDISAVVVVVVSIVVVIIDFV